MAKPWGLLSRFLLFSVAFALGMASNFLLRSLPNSATPTTTVIQLADTVPSAPPPPPPRAKKEDQQLGKEEGGGGGAGRVVMLHNMTDDELLLRASMTTASPRIKGISALQALGAPKVAFMFLVRGDLPLAPLWERFFEGHRGMYSVYVHPDPSYAGSPEKGSSFYGRRVPSKEARWGKSSIAEAERRLLANALLDVGNARFVLLSESCIPLFNFTTVHSYLTHSTTSFVELFDAPGFHVRGRYRPAMAPTVTPAHWRKGSQWFAADRGLALEAVADETYFPVFQQHCAPPCVMDEHYLPTFIAAFSGRSSRNANRTLTYARWTPGSPHPESYGKDLVTAELLEGVRNDRNCTTDGGLSDGEICYLFARKFLPAALPELLRLAPRIMGYG
ncbi:uncharacterized protein LOC104584106 [Brachypodium distachyon]|uniref:Uncharacterized protein n=1 Tax=Brachypodium distachyon TaxID=15368 RepID=A0A0Q3I7D7_BRADI|nr:uncharacterized protein LOC104584106 [Brachypodium distachyon]KQJ96395.1 hypothetical protein BRADI_3g22875v3 [Brachypodium distachyon]|eukprot:XP_010236546.1 uncharacterized protein LOC104584106 [Brachypodium distachyon]